VSLAATSRGVVPSVMRAVMRSPAPLRRGTPSTVTMVSKSPCATMTDRERKITFGQMRFQVYAALSFLGPTIDAAIQPPSSPMAGARGICLKNGTAGRVCFVLRDPDH
jgi:hypothetical protein